MMDETSTTTETTDSVGAMAADVAGAMASEPQSSDNGALSGVNSESQANTASQGNVKSKSSQEGGALAGDGEKAETLDFAKMTDDEYTAKLEKIEGLNQKEFAKVYGKFCRDEKLSPEVVSKYLKMEKGILDGQRAERAKAMEAKAKAFQEEGKTLRKEYNPQQINTAIQGLKSLGADDKFMKYAKGELSNNPTLVKLLINWNETHGEDGAPGTNGLGMSGEKTFEQVWTGK